MGILQGPVCQHGPQECALNKIINCAIDLNPGQNKWFPFVECVESNITKGITAGKSCAEQLGIDDSSLQECNQGSARSRLLTAQGQASRLNPQWHVCLPGPHGDELILAAAKRTAALQPPHEYVPWVLANGIPLGDSAGNLEAIVCAAYDGKRCVLIKYSCPAACCKFLCLVMIPSGHYITLSCSKP